MARIRTIKPDFFKHEGLFDAESDSGMPLRVAFAGIWTQCDRHGRFAWRPRQLKSDVLPYDDVDFSRVLDALATRGFIIKYASEGELFGFIPTWTKHQVINNRESEGDIPAPNHDAIEDAKERDASATRAAREDDAIRKTESGREGKGTGKEGKGATSVLPVEVATFPNVAPSQASGASAEEPSADAEEAADNPEVPARFDRRRYPDDFEAVWAEYRPIASPNATKADAATAFRRLSAADKSACWTGVVRYVQWIFAERAKDPSTKTKHLATFIHKRGWETFQDEGVAA